MTAAAIEVRSVTKAYADERVLDSVDLSVAEGEFCVVVGPSGCGKTTLLDCIAGLRSVDAGRVSYFGEDVTDAPVSGRDVGYVFQDFEETLFPHRSTAENVAFGLRHGGGARSPEEIERAVDEVLELLAIGETRDSPPPALSGGQQQRVELARQLVRECDVMLFDDPLSDLDYKLGKRMELEMRRIHRERGDTFLYVTHDQDQALKLADRLVVMNRGTIEQVGPPTEVYERPANAFVARFVGDSNPLVGRLDRDLEGEAAAIETEIGEVEARTAPASIPEGTESMLIVRPERVAIGQDVGDRTNRFEATLEGQTYTGRYTEFAVSLDDGPDEFIAIQPGNADVGEAGDRLEVGWNAEDCWFFEALSASPGVTVDDLMEL